MRDVVEGSTKTVYKDCNGDIIRVGDIVKDENGTIGVAYYDTYLDGCLIRNVLPANGVSILKDICNEVTIITDMG